MITIKNRIDTEIVQDFIHILYIRLKNNPSYDVDKHVSFYTEKY